jgi:hypothetical protein
MQGQHEPTAMVYSHRSNKKHRHNTRHGVVYRNHWFEVFRCPHCGRTASHKPRPIVCRGDDKAEQPEKAEGDRMNDYIVKVECEGDTWYVHATGDRINNHKTASRYTLAKAEAIAEVYRLRWRATATVIDAKRRA